MLCEVCGEAEALHRCSMCGRLVCPRHFDRGRGVCTFCVQALCQVCGRMLSITHCAVCGRLVCLDCSVQVNTVIHVCSKCHEALGGREAVLTYLRERKKPPRMPGIRAFVERVLRASRRGRV